METIFFCLDSIGQYMMSSGNMGIALVATLSMVSGGGLALCPVSFYSTKILTLTIQK